MKTGDQKCDYTYGDNDSYVKIDYAWDGDNNTWVNSSKHVCNYDTKERITSEIIYTWNGSSWVPQNQGYEEYTYDTNGNVITTIAYEWDSTAGEFKPTTKVLNGNDGHGNFIVRSEYSWNGTGWTQTLETSTSTVNGTYIYTQQKLGADGTWANFAQDMVTYDANWRVIADEGYDWDGESNCWMASYKYTNTYTNGLLTEYIEYGSNSDKTDFVLNTKLVYDYDTNGNQILNARYDYDTSTSAWTFYSKSVYAFDDNDNMTLNEHYSSDDVISYKEEWTYDTNDNMTSFIEYNTGDSGTLVPSSKQEYTFDANSNELSFASYDWNNAWVGKEKSEHTYDEHGCMLTETNYEGDGNGDWVLSNSQTYHYLNKPEDVIIGTALYATYIPTNDIDEIPDGITAYRVKKVDTTENTITISPIDAIPAGEPVVLKATAAGTYTFQPATGAVSAIENLLQASQMGIKTTDEGMWYALASRNSEVGFYQVNTDVVIPEDKGYLWLASSAAKALRFANDGESTGIVSIEQESNSGDIVIRYRLDGQRVSDNARGIIISAGRKYVNK